MGSPPTETQILLWVWNGVGSPGREEKLESGPTPHEVEADGRKEGKVWGREE